jgi:hypothetical protein
LAASRVARETMIQARQDVSVSRQAVCLKASSRFSHSLIRFQLALFWSTIFQVVDPND